MVFYLMALPTLGFSAALIGLCCCRRNHCNSQACGRNDFPAPKESDGIQASEDTASSVGGSADCNRKLHQLDLDSDGWNSSSDNSEPEPEEGDDDRPIIMHVDVDYPWYEPEDGVGEVNLIVRPLRASMVTPLAVVRPVDRFAKDYSRDSQILDEARAESDSDMSPQQEKNVPKKERGCSRVWRDAWFIGQCSERAQSCGTTSAILPRSTSSDDGEVRVPERGRLAHQTCGPLRPLSSFSTAAPPSSMSAETEGSVSAPAASAAAIVELAPRSPARRRTFDGAVAGDGDSVTTPVAAAVASGAAAPQPACDSVTTPMAAAVATGAAAPQLAGDSVTTPMVTAVANGAAAPQPAGLTTATPVAAVVASDFAAPQRAGDSVANPVAAVVASDSAEPQPVVPEDELAARSPARARSRGPEPNELAPRSPARVRNDQDYVSDTSDPSDQEDDEKEDDSSSEEEEEESEEEYDEEEEEEEDEEESDDEPKDPSSCAYRLPSVGDLVCFFKHETSSFEDAKGKKGAWRIGAGERVKVVKVDKDGDFKLRNAAGLTSCWQYRKYYNYCQQDVVKNDVDLVHGRMRF